VTTRPTPMQVQRAARELGGYISTWRKLMRFTSQQVADKAGISRGTVSRLENGDPNVSLAAYLGVLRVLDRLDDAVKVLDPYETEFGRAQSEHILPERVRK